MLNIKLTLEIKNKDIMKRFIITLLACFMYFFAFSNNVIERGDYDNGNKKYELIAIPGIDGDTYEYKEYHRNGELSVHGNYDEFGRKSGEWLRYYQDGDKLSYSFYSNGQKHGNWFIYDKDGSILSEYEYKNGEKHGKWIQYDKDGDLIAKRKYKRGKKHGEWLSYDDQGRLIVLEEYKRGDLIDGWTWNNSEGLIARYP